LFTPLSACGTFPLKGKGLKEKLMCAPCNPASQIFAGKSTEIYALPLITLQPKAGSKRERWGKAREKSLDAAAIEISVGFYKNCVAIFYTDKNNMII